MKKAIVAIAGFLNLLLLQAPPVRAQIRLANSIQTVAGSGMAGYSGDGSAAATSNLNLPGGAAVDSSRNVFVADTGNSAIRRIDAVTGAISTFAGTGHAGITVDGTAATTSSLNAPGGVSVDSNGDVFIADTGNNRVVVVFGGGAAAAALITAVNPAVTSPVTGSMYTLAGTSVAGFSGDGADALKGQLQAPAHVAVDTQGDLYIADTGNHRVRVVYAGGSAAKSYILAASPGTTAPVAGAIYTVVGTGTATSTGDGGTAGAATLNSPASVALDLQNNIYIAEKGGNRVRAVYLGSTALASLIALESPGTAAVAGDIYTLAGTGTAGASGDGALASTAALNQPTGLAVDAASNLYIADSANGAVRQIQASTGFIATYAGSLTLGSGFSGDGGLATQGQLQTPTDVALDPASGALYVADSTGGQRLRVVSTGSIFPTTGVGSKSPTQNVLLRFTSSDTLRSIAVTSSGTTPEYTLGSIANCPTDGVTAIAAGTVCSVAIAFNPQFPGQRSVPLVLTDTAGAQYPFTLTGLGTGPLASILPGQIVTVAGNGKATFQGDGGPAVSASLYAPANVSVDASGNIFINDNSNNRIRVVYGGGQTVGHLITLENPAITSPVIGDIYTIAGNGSTSNSSSDGGLASATSLSNYVSGMAVDGADNVFIDDQGSSRVLMVSAATGKIATVAGMTGAVTSTPNNGDYGQATAAKLYLSYVLAVDNIGNLYLGNGTNQIRKVSLGTGIITTIAGVGGFSSNGATLDEGPALSARFSSLQSLYVDSYQNIYVGDPGSRRIAIIYSGGTANPAANLILATHSLLTAPIPGYIYTVAGYGSAGYSGDGGLATQAQLGFFNQIAVDAAGNIYLTDRTSNYIRKVDSKTGIIRTIAGNGAAGAAGDGGAATSASLYSPFGLGIDSAGNVYVPESANQRIRKITAAGYPLTFPTTTVGSTSTAQNVTLSNTGNQPFLPTSIATTTGFNTSSSTTCSAAYLLAFGDSCLAAVTFVPQVNGTTTGSLTFTGQTLQASLALTGVGTGGVTTQTTLTTLATAVYGQLITVKSTVTAGGAPVTAGKVIFSVGTSVLGSAQLDSTGTASTSLSAPAVGNYQLIATFQQTGVNMSSAANSNLAITSAPLTVTADNKSTQYGSPVPALTYTVSGFVNGDTASTAFTGSPSLSTTATSQSKVGTYPITIAQNTLAAANYSLSFVNGTLTVAGNVSQTISFAPISNTVYGAVPFTLSPSASSGLPVTISVLSGPATVSGYTVTITGAGTVVLQAAQPGNQYYAAAPSVQQSFLVKQATSTVTVKSATRAYGASEPAFTSTVNGLVNGDALGSSLTIAYQSADTASSSVGSYAIQAQISGPSAGNYSFTIVPGVLTVTQAPLTLTITNASRTYGSQNPVFTAVISGLVNGDSLSTNLAEQLSSAATVTSPVGAYAITGAISGSASANYSVTVIPATLTVTPAVLTATASAASRMYGQPNPVFSGTFSGALNGDVFTESFTTAATQTTNAGNYSIVPSLSGPAIGNYTVSATNGLLSIYLANSATTLTSPAATVSYGSPLVLTADAVSSTTGTPTGTVSFYDGSTLLGTAALSSGVATYTASGLLLGTHTFSAAYAGDYDFYGSTSAATAISIVAASYAIVPSSGTLTLSGQQTATDTLAVTGVGGYSGTISFSCGNLPAGLQCSFSPGTATLSASAASQSVTLSISRTTTAAAIDRRGTGPVQFAGAGLAGILLLLGLGRRSVRKLHSGMSGVLSVCALAAATAFAGCAGGSSTTASATPAGSYQILVQANASAGSSSSVPLTITVQ